MDGKFPGAVKCPAVGMNLVEGKCPAPKTPLELWPDVKCANVFFYRRFLFINVIVLDSKFPKLESQTSIVLTSYRMNQVQLVGKRNIMHTQSSRSYYIRFGDLMK